MQEKRNNPGDDSEIYRIIIVLDLIVNIKYLKEEAL